MTFPRTLALLTAMATTLLSSCSGLDSRTEDSLRQAEQELSQNPNQALERLNTILAKHPQALRVHRAKALALESLDRAGEAVDEWQILVERAAQLSVPDALESHRSFVRLSLLVAGDLPHRIESPTSEEQAALTLLEQSCEEILRHQGGDPIGLYGLGFCNHLLGRQARAKANLDRLIRDQPELQIARYLAHLVEIELVGLDPARIESLLEMAAKSDPDLRRQIVVHLVWLAEKTGPANRARPVLLRALDQLADLDLTPDVDSMVSNARSQQRQRADRELAEGLYLRALEAKREGHWAQAWDLLSQAAQSHPPLQDERAKFAQEWADRLVQTIDSALESGKVTNAGDDLQRLALLPSDSLDENTLARRTELQEVYEVQEIRLGVETAMSQVRTLLGRRDGLRALDLLDTAEPKVTVAQRVAFDLLYAEALYYYDRSEEAMQLLDELNATGALKEHRDSVVYRVYGVLLARLGRSEQAERVLQDLPLELKNSEAFTALLDSLEKQGKWEAVLAQLSTLSFVPDEYRPRLRHCASEAARRRLRGQDPEGAQRLLESYLSESDLDHVDVQPVHLEVLIGVGDFDRASDVILNADLGLLKSLPRELVEKVKARAADELTEEQRFHLYRLLLKGENDPEISAQVLALWPRWGPYLPEAGDYVANYQVRTISSGGRTSDLQKIDRVFQWKDGKYTVTESGSAPETWQVLDGNLLRTRLGQTHRIPARVRRNPPFKVEQFRANNTLWSAQVREAGTTIEVQGRTYSACLKIQLIDESRQDEYTMIYLAPSIGPVLRETYRFSNLIEVTELLNFSRTRAQ